MVAKGHDFPDVSLGVVLDADQTLRFPDFRAEERTFALVTQLAGRTGRGALGGRVLVQTLAPEARPIAFATRHDADGFIADELIRRARAGLPAVLVADPGGVLGGGRGPRPGHGDRDRRRASIARRPRCSDRRRCSGLRGRARSQLVVKATERQPAIDAVGAAVDRLAPEAARRGASVSVDVDPQ